MLWLLKFSLNLGLKCPFEGLLRLPIRDFALCSHGAIKTEGIHTCSKIDRTTHSKIMQPLGIFILKLEIFVFGKPLMGTRIT